MNQPIEIIRAKRKTICVQVKRDLRVVVRAPMRMKKSDIQKFIADMTPWIEKNLQKMKERLNVKEEVLPFTKDEIQALFDKSVAAFPPLVEEWAERIGVSYGRITIRNQQSRWGSCSSKGNLNFNCLLMLCPPAVVEYVVIHELCHRKHMNHSAEFWALVAWHCPDYKVQKKWLNEEGDQLLRRLRANG